MTHLRDGGLIRNNSILAKGILTDLEKNIVLFFKFANKFRYMHVHVT